MNDNDKSYLLTEDGFGVHTFELNFSSWVWKDYYTVLKNVRSSGCYVVTNGNKKRIPVIPKNHKGIRMYIGQTENVWNIKVIVTPRMLLDNDSSPISILRCCDSMKEMEVRFNAAMFEILGEGFRLDDFFLSRVDCCVNIMLSETYSAARYIKLIRRSIMYNSNAKIIEYGSDDPNTDEKNRHSFRIETDGLQFTAYDKYFQLENQGKDYESISDSLLRLEIAVGRERIRCVKLDNNLENNRKILRYFVSSGKKVFNDFIKKHFYNGAYCSYQFMRALIADSDCTHKIKERMLEFSKVQYNYDSVMDIKNIFLNEIGGSKYGSMIKAFNRLGISPISLSTRDQHGRTMIPGLYTLLQLGKE